MATITFTEKIEVQECCVCGITFGTTASFDARRREDKKSFFCPSGHSQSYLGETEADRLRKELAAKERELLAAKSRVEAEQRRTLDARDQRDAVQRSLSATKAVVTRTKKKIVAGRCPCCSTKFKDLAVHMKIEHPNYDPEKAAVALEAKA